MYRTVINAKGQVTIPAELRKRLQIKPGTRVTWTEEKGRLVLAHMTGRRMKEIMGFLKPKPGEHASHRGHADVDPEPLSHQELHDLARPQAEIEAVLARISAIHPAEHLLLLPRV